MSLQGIFAGPRRSTNWGSLVPSGQGLVDIPGHQGGRAFSLLGIAKLSTTLLFATPFLWPQISEMNNFYVSMDIFKSSSLKFGI